MFGPFKKSARLQVWQEQQRAARQEAWAERWHDQKRLLIRLFIGAITVVAVTLIIDGGDGEWGPPFIYREGEVYSRDLRVKVNFAVVNEQATQLKREQVAIFREEPVPLMDLRSHLTELCLAAFGGSVDRIPEETLRFWALTDNDLKSLRSILQLPPEDVVALLQITPTPCLGRFASQTAAALALRKSRQPVESETDLRLRLNTVFDQLALEGILDDKDLPESVRLTKKLSIVRWNEDVDDEVALERVLKSTLIGKPPKDSPLYLQFSRALKNEALAERLFSLVVGDDKRPRRLPGTLRFDREATDAARSQIVQTTEYKRGMPLVEQGDPLDDKDLTLLKEEHRTLVANLSATHHARRGFAVFLIVAMLGGLIGWSAWQYASPLMASLPKLFGVCMLILVTMELAVLISPAPWFAAIVPLTMASMFLAVAFGQPFALMVAFCMALASTLSTGETPGYFLVLSTGLAIAVLCLNKVRTRIRLIHVGLLSGLTFAVMTIAEGFLTDQNWRLIGSDSAWRFFFGLLSAVILSGLLPFLERAFATITDISLLELADVSHPLIQELLQRAPGTYTHSMTVATMAETAAEAVGANPLLARVGACFHDVGKMLKPHYFVENQMGENRHEGLAPAMSTLVIIGHVKDGVELGKQHSLPDSIIDFIQQHHGTTLIEYFYHEATKDLDPAQADSELEASFRYPGPKPQTKEIGVVMLADAMEGAARSLDEPTPSSLMKLVHEIVMKRLLDGQFDECGLTLQELHIIEESLSKSLIALYHSRIKYPEAKTAG